MKPIMGSETEFGLVPKSGRVDRFILRILGDSLNSRVTDGFLESIIQKVNWWKEDFSSKEEIENDEPDKLRRLGLSGEYLRNGARFYVDCFHPEYSTPECTNPWELVAYEKAGEKIVSAAVRKIKDRLGADADLLKRNADYRGTSYACHENYFLTRGLFRQIVHEEFTGPLECPLWLSMKQAIWVMHRISMLIFSGAGSILANKEWPECFVLSQRQRFIKYFSALGTTESRSIINTRDRPYADPVKFARLHVICGDSNRADWSNILKYGTSALLLGALEDYKGTSDERFLVPLNPVQDFRSLKSHDSAIETLGGTITALKAQRIIAQLARSWVERGAGSDWKWAPELLQMWDSALDLIERQDDRIYSLFDYYVKKRVFEERAGSGAGYSSKKLRALEYSYHLLSDGSLFEYLAERGWIERVVGEADVVKAISVPPATRARTRSRFLRLFSGRALNSWHIIRGESKRKGNVFILMRDPSSFGYEIEQAERRRFYD